MNKRAREFIVKLFSLILAITMSIPTNVFASSGTKRPKEMPTVIRLADSGGGGDTYIEDTTEDTYIEDGEEFYTEDTVESTPQETTEVIEEAPQEEAYTIAEEDARNYILSQKARLNDNHDGIIYDIKVAKKEKSYHDPAKNLSLSLMLNPNQALKDIKLTKVVIDGKEEKRDDKSNKVDNLQTLNLTTTTFENEITYTVEASIDKKAIDANKLYSMDLSLDIGQFNLDLQRISYKFVEYEKEDKTKELKLTHIKEAEDALRSISYKKDDGDVDKVIYTDYIISKDKGDEESRVNEKNKIQYGLNLENLKKEDTEISLDYYKADDKGFNIKKEFSAKIPYQDKLDLDIPASYILKLTVTSKTDKKNTKIESHKINGREVKSPRFVKEEEKSSEDDEEAAKKAEEEKKAAEEKAKAEETRKAEEAKKAEAEKQAEEANKAEEEAKSAEEKREAQEKAKSEQEAKEAKEQEASDKLKAEKEASNKEAKKKDDLLNSLKEESPTKEEENKAKTEVKEDSNLSKADAELKAALADKTKGIEDIQNLLTSIGEKYKLTREDQAKLMTANDAAIKALVEKDREENFRPNNLRATGSFEDKKFKLTTKMKVIASEKNPMPRGWHFDVNLGNYLKEDPSKPIADLKDNTGKVIATGSYDKDNHKIRYTITEKLTSPVNLTIDQLLAFDMNEIGDTNPINIDNSVQPKNMTAQKMNTITVSKDDEAEIISSQPGFTSKIESPENVTGTVEYPVILEYRSHQTLRDENGEEAVLGIVSNPQNLEVWWDIEVEIDKLFPADKELDFNRLYFTLFASGKQGLKDGKYKIAGTKAELDEPGGYSGLGGGDLMVDSKAIDKNTLADPSKYPEKKVYIRAKLPLKAGEYHSNYSLGLRVNPDRNYMEKIYKEFMDDYRKIPSIFKFIQGEGEAKKLANTPFNLVEDMFVADFVHLGDPTVDENFYYDRTRTIVAEQDDDYSKRRWTAMDLLRIGETEDYSLANASLFPESLKYTKYYYIPSITGGYSRTTNQNLATLSDGSYKPGVIVYYDYNLQSGTKDTTFKLDVNLKQKPVDNADVINKYDNIETEGGQQYLYSRKLQQNDDAYLAYLELPYLIMRINNTFEMVQCLNARRPDPTVNGNKTKVGLDRIENPTGAMLYSNIADYGDFKANDTYYDLLPGGKYNRNNQTKEDATEDLFKRIYFYAEEIKREYPGTHNNTEMHRIIENQMLQRVIHYFTDGKALTNDYAYVGTPTEDDDKYHHDITLTDPNMLHKDQYFKGDNGANSDTDGHRKLSENEKLDLEKKGLKDVQVQYAQELLKRVQNSYNNDDWEKYSKANTVTLVYFDHQSAKYQKLISGRVVDPITAYKVDSEGNKLDGAEFSFVNRNTGEVIKATATSSGMKVYLPEGSYRVRETKAPEGYDLIDPFNITVTNDKVNPDAGQYPAVGMRIKVHDGYKTEGKLSGVPQDINGNDLVKQENGKLEIEIVNISNKLGKLQFEKRDASKKLNGSEFTLTKIKSQTDTNPELGSDNKPVYQKKSTGNYGDFEFTEMPVGFYLLEETVVPKGYKKAANQIIEVSLDDNGKAVTKFLDEDIEASAPKVIINEAKTIDIKLRKVDNSDDKHKLQDAKFRLYSQRTLDNVLYFEESTSGIDGIVNFKGIKEGEYILEELAAPSGYLLPKFLEGDKQFFGWKLFVKQNDRGDLVYDIYKLKTREDAKKTEAQLQDSKINLDDVLKDGAVNIGNQIRTVDWEFKKYIENPNFDASKPESETNPKYIQLLDKTKLDQIKFNVYEADYYGKIININKPFLQDIKADANGVFHLKGLKFNGYYTLREMNTHGDYSKASDITLKIEAETIANEGEMKVIVRDPSNDVILGEHGILKSVINYKKGSELGKFAIKKTGKSLWPQDKGKEVGLRRAFFRLYTADDKFNIKLNAAGYPEKYIQKVTDGEALTDDKGNPTDTSTFQKNQGIAVFENLKPGKYVLEEYRGPAGYEKDPRPIYVQVTADGKVFKSRDKNDPIVNQTGDRSANTDQSFNDVTSGLDENASANSDAEKAVKTKTYQGTYSTVTIEAGQIDGEKGSRRMKVTVAANRETIDFSLFYNYYIEASNWNYNNRDGIYNASSSNQFYKYSIQPNNPFTVEFDAKLKDGTEEDVYKNILSQVRVWAKYSQRYEYHRDAIEDFKLVKESNNYKAKVEFEYNYFDYEGKGEMSPLLFGTGKIWLETFENGKWVKVDGSDRKAYKDSQKPEEFPEFTNLDKNKKYRIAYKLVDGYNLQYLWNWTSDTSYYNIDPSLADENGDVLIKISNGNLLKIFNKDEDGFRIPLRIEKSNEDKSPLSGAVFRAKKIVDGEMVKGKNFYPKYYDEPFDAVTEATGLAGENYFRELTPGIYELWEEKAPDEYKELKSKWYFKVEVDPSKEAHEENYMRIVFDFSYRFPNDLSDKKYQHLTEAEKNRLRGKTIFGLDSTAETKFEDNRLPTDSYKEFVRNVKILPDNEISKPARPDAPYKGIDVVGVTNHKSLGKLEFKKVDSNNETIDGAKFKLTKVRVESNGKLIIKSPDVGPDPEKDSDGDPVYLKEVISQGILGVRFEGISEGTYLLEEVNPPQGYNMIKSYLVIRFKENEDGKIVQEVDREQSDPDFLKHINFKNGSEIESIVNYEKLTKLSFEKIDSKGNKVGTSSFNLQLVDENGKVKTNEHGQNIYDRTLEKYDDLSKYEFTDLKVGRYRLKEINHTIYAKPEAWFFNVREDAKGNLFIEFEKKDDKSIIKNIDGSYKVVNYAKTNFQFTKIGQGQDSPPVPLSDFYFSLKKVRTDKTEDGLQIFYDDNGVVTSMKDKSGNERIEKDKEGFVKNPEILEYSYYSKTKTRGDGSINFQGLTPGVYELEELTEHASYNTNTQRRWIILVEPGTDKLNVSYDKNYEGNYYAKYDTKYYNDFYKPRNFENSKFLIGNENEGFNVINIRDKIDIKWRKVDSETGAIIHDEKGAEKGLYDDKNARFELNTLHDGVVAEGSQEFMDALNGKGTRPPGRPPQLQSVEGYYGIYGMGPGVYAIPETQYPAGYKMKNQRSVVILVTERGKLKADDPNYQANSKELVYKLFEVKSKFTSVGQPPTIELVSNPNEFELISVDKNGEIIFNDNFFDYKNEPEENQGSFVIDKKDSKNRPLEGAVFELLDSNEEVIRQAKSDKNGKLVFAGLTEGTYTLKESQPPIGFKQSNKVWKVFVYANGHTFVREGDSVENPPADSDTNYERPIKEVKNEPIQETGEFTVSKVDKEDNKALPGATFKLEMIKDQDGKDLDSRITIAEKVSDKDGKIKFEKLQPGTYELTETKAPEDYKMVSDKWTITVAKDGNTTVVKSTANIVARSAQKLANAINPDKILRAADAEVPIKDIEVPNEKQNYGNFQIKKTDIDKKTVLAGAEFTLTRVKDELDNEVTDEDPIKVTSGTDGIAKFDKVKPGEYKLKETKAPQGYEAPNEEYTVKVEGVGGKVSVKITKPSTTEENMTSTVTPSEESTLIFTSYDGWEYTEGKVKYDLAKTRTPGEYWLAVEYTPTSTNYNAKRVLNLIFDTDNFDVSYNGTKIAANQANISLYTHQNNGLQRANFFLKAKDITKDQTLYPIKQFSWAGQVGHTLDKNPESYPKIELKKETTTIDGEELELIDKNSFVYNLVNNKVKHKTQFRKVGKEVANGKVTFTPLANAVFVLEKKVTDENGKEKFERIYRSFISDSKGNLVLDNLEAGEYKLFETIPPEGYRPIGIAVKEFMIDELGRTMVKNRDEEYAPLDEESKDIVNEKLGTESYEFTKRDGVTKEPLIGVEFELLNSNGDVVATKTSDASGKVKFDNLTPGKYWIREKSQLPGYIKENNLVKIVVGEQWKAPKYENARNVSKYFSLDPLKPSTMTSTTGNETVVYPNVQEGLFAKLNYTINTKVNAGDTFVMAFSENIDLDGLATIDDREFDIYGPMGRIAEAKIRDDRRTIDYTFTEALDFYKDLKELTINTQMFVKRQNTPFDKENFEVSIMIQETDNDGAVFKDTIDVNYDNSTNDGYINALENVKTYQLRLGTSSESPREFKNVIYVNPKRAKDGYKDIYFSADLPYSVKDVKVYKRVGKENAHLPWSFDIDHTNDSAYGLQEITSPKWDIVGGKIHIDLGDEYNTDEYVIEISGTVNEIGDFRTKTEYYRISPYYNHTWYNYYPDRQVIDYWETWAKVYNPDAQADLVQDFGNYKNRIEYTKVTKGTETPLALAKFELRKDDGNGTFTKIDGLDKTSGEDGKFFWEGLEPGKYQVWEIDTPKGYVAPNYAVSSFEVTKDGQITNIKDKKTTIENEKVGMKFYIDKIWKGENGDSNSIKNGTLELKLTANDDGRTFPADLEEQEEIPEGAAYRIKEIAADRKSITLEIDLSKAYEEITVKEDGKDVNKSAIKIDVPADWPQGRYSLTETKAPAGYNKTDEIFSLFVDHKNDEIRHDETVLYKKGETSDTISILEIENKKGIFPYTGGPGVWIGFTILGVLTMTAAGIYLAQKKKYQTK